MKTEKQLAYIEALRMIDEAIKLLESINETHPIMNSFKAEAIESLYDAHATLE